MVHLDTVCLSLGCLEDYNKQTYIIKQKKVLTVQVMEQLSFSLLEQIKITKKEKSLKKKSGLLVEQGKINFWPTPCGTLVLLK